MSVVQQERGRRAVQPGETKEEFQASSPSAVVPNGRVKGFAECFTRFQLHPALN